MPKRAEGTCPDCGATLGIQVADSIAMLLGGNPERFMEKDGNGVRCPNCDEYRDPSDMEIVK